MAVISIPYAPRKVFVPFHDRDKRWSCLVCHRRAGKTVACVNELIRAALTTTRENGRFAYVAPQYSQAKDIAWGYVKQFTGAIPGIQYNESELRADFPNGARVRLYGTENESRLRGLYLDGVILDEYADIHPRVFDEIIRPLLSDRQGWAVFIGTPMGHNAFYETYQRSLQSDEWYSIMLKASQTGILDPVELEAAKRDMSEDAFEQEFECSFEAAIKGAVFGKEMKMAEEDGRITSVPYDSSSEVWTGWDLGIGDATAIWFVQQVGREPRIIDFYMARGASIDHYVKVLKDKPYNYARHLLPHDADKTELGSGQSIIEQLKGMGVRNTRVVKKLSIHERIEIGRRFLRMCYFDRKRCHEGIEALKVYRYEYDALTGVNSRKPIHNWASHPSDAFTYLAVGFKPESMHAAPIKYPSLAIP
jgi:hypothetical protein